MMGDKQVEEYLGVLEPLLSHVIVTENSWRDRVMPAEDLKTVAERVFGAERVTCVPELPDAIQEAVNMVDADDELGVGYGHGVLICGSFTTAGDARLMLEEKVNPDLKKPKSERVFQELLSRNRVRIRTRRISISNPTPILISISTISAVSVRNFPMMKILMLPKLSMRMLHLLKICGNRIYAWR